MAKIKSTHLGLVPNVLALDLVIKTSYRVLSQCPVMGTGRRAQQGGEGLEAGDVVETDPSCMLSTPLQGKHMHWRHQENQ